MKYLIAGLGNIGDEYANTRHNVGFMAVDHLAKELGAEWKSVTLGSMAQTKFRGRTLLLLKPNTYMNLSGKSIAYWMQKEKISPENLLVILDELQLELGAIRLRGKGSDGGHNGLKDIQEQLNSTEYARLRIGIGNDFHAGQQVRYVLGEWTDEEQKELDDILTAAGNAVKAFTTIGLKRAMDQVNAKSAKPKKEKEKEKPKSPPPQTKE